MHSDTLFLVVLLALSLGVTARGADVRSRPVCYFVAPNGNDAWSGRLEKPNKARTDGPVASLVGARDAIRRLKASGGLREPIRVIVKEGTYSLTEPFVLEPQDSGTEQSPITYTAYPGSRPVISGGRAIKGWKKHGNLWVAEIPEAKSGAWYFSGLWVNGERRVRARTPNEGYFHTAGKAPAIPDPKGGKPLSMVSRAFRFRPGDIRAWDNLDEVLVVVYQSWETSTHRIASVDEEKHIVTFKNAAPWPFEYWGPKVRYYVENVPEALDAPGEWYLDRKTGLLSYIPFPGEALTKATVVAPVAKQLIVLLGKPAERQFVEHVHFENVRLMHTDFTISPQGYSSGQAACEMPGAIEAVGARNCSVEGCEIAHVGTYGVWLRFGCQDNRIARNDIHDLGAGGARLGETSDPKTEPETAQRNVVDNNFIHDGGKIDAGAVGVWIGRTSYNTVSHNEICDLYYTGVSVGWSWGYAPSSAHHNLVGYNHIHDIGRGVLGDMGGIYCLGDSPGTVLRNNVVHDVYDYRTGSLAIYTDEGSTGILIENNIGYHTTYANFHQHYGKENIVRNNIWAFGKDCQLSRARQEDHISFTFERNIVYFDNGKLLKGGWTNGKFRMDYNLYWDTSHPEGDLKFADWTFAEWQAQGHDQHSLIADPGFVNAKKLDFRLKPSSPAFKLGFQPIDVSKVGLYGEPKWVNAPKRIRRKPFVPPPPPPAPGPTPISEAFEELPVGAQPEDVALYTENDAASILVTDEAAASGKHSLKFTDAAGQQYSFNPHMVFSPNFQKGVMAGSFDLRVEAGAFAVVEWRDAANPYHVGPSIYVEPDGRVLSQGKELGRVEHGQWFHYEVACGLGDQANGTWSLRFGPLGNQEIQRFDNLPCSPEFQELRWLGFVSNAVEAAVFYVDNILLKPKQG